MAQTPLRGCPTCGTKLAEAAAGLGFRDYRWVSKYLPGRVAPTDVDGVLERNGHFLVMEYKPKGVALPMGQRIMLKHLVRRGGFNVWVVWGDDSSEDALCEVASLDRNGDVLDVETITAGQLGARVRAWLDWATAAGPYVPGGEE